VLTIDSYARSTVYIPQRCHLGMYANYGCIVFLLLLCLMLLLLPLPLHLLMRLLPAAIVVVYDRRNNESQQMVSVMLRLVMHLTLVL
jgi:hypothetical protein